MTPHAGVAGVPRLVLRAEGAALFAVALVAYAKAGATWWLMLVLFLLPDLSFLAYFLGARAGSIAYNAAHTLVGPLLLAIAGLLWPMSDLMPLALIWSAHIGFDRLLGYGLKYGEGFGYTHLGRLGRFSDKK